MKFEMLKLQQTTTRHICVFNAEHLFSKKINILQEAEDALKQHKYKVLAEAGEEVQCALQSERTRTQNAEMELSQWQKAF